MATAAGAKSSLIDSSCNLVLKAPHPSPLSAYRGFLGCRHFSKANQYLCSIGKTPVIDLKQIVARQFQLNLLVGDFQRVMDIVRGRSLRMSGTTAIFAHNPALIFEAGNEYRRFETVTDHYPGMGVERIDLY